MNELISVTTDGKTTSKDLYSFLQLDPGNYTRWCKVNIIENQFSEEGIDWGLLLPQEEKLNYRPSQNYWLTIPFAKKLCMVSPTERGEQARNYFIEVEKQFKQQKALIQLPDFTNPAVAARAWADEVEKKLEAQKMLEIAQPKADVFTMICEDEGFTLTADQIAKNACQSGLTGTQVRIILRAENILCKNKNEPTAEAVRKGLARLMVEEIDTGWTKKIVSVPKFRGKVIDIVVSSWKKKSGYLL